MLERQYASQLSKPELQLAVNSTTTNNTLVITAEAAQALQARASIIDAQVEKIVASKQANPASQASNGTSSQASKPEASEPSKPRRPSKPASRGKRSEEGKLAGERRGGAMPYPYPRCGGRPPVLPLPRNCRILRLSSNYKLAGFERRGIFAMIAKRDGKGV